MHATITNHPTGALTLTATSTCTINGQTVTVPLATDSMGHFPPPRVIAALAALGYRPDGDYYQALDITPDGFRVRVVPA